MNWNEDIVYDVINSMTIHYVHGDAVTTSVDFDYSDSLAGEIETAYVFEDYDSGEKMFVYHDLEGAEIMINTDNVSVIELPLSKIEDEINRIYDEMKES